MMKGPNDNLKKRRYLQHLPGNDESVSGSHVAAARPLHCDGKTFN